MEETLRKARAGDAEAMNAAVTAYLPWAKRRASRHTWPWRDFDAAYSIAAESVWLAIRDNDDEHGDLCPIGLAAVIYRRRQIAEVRDHPARRRTEDMAFSLDDHEDELHLEGTEPDPLESLVARQEENRRWQIACGFAAEDAAQRAAVDARRAEIRARVSAADAREKTSSGTFWDVLRLARAGRRGSTLLTPGGSVDPRSGCA